MQSYDYVLTLLGPPLVEGSTWPGVKSGPGSLDLEADGTGLKACRLELKDMGLERLTNCFGEVPPMNAEDLRFPGCTLESSESSSLGARPQGYNGRMGRCLGGHKTNDSDAESLALGATARALSAFDKCPTLRPSG